VQTLQAEMQDVKQDIKSLQDGQVALRTAVANLAGAFEQMDKRLGDFAGQMDQRFRDFAGQMDQRFGDFAGQMDQRFGDFAGQVDKRFGDFQSQVDKRFGDLNARVTSLENWMRWGVGILLLSWLTIMTSIWLK
jgi:uncharacterized protein YukE